MRTNSLTAYTIDGLKRCYVPERGIWSYKYHLDGRSPANELLPRYDVFYSLNVLLGLSKARVAAQAAFDTDLSDSFKRIAAHLGAVEVPRYAFGTALWVAAELSVEVPRDVAGAVRRMTSRPEILQSWRAQDLGMLLSGAAAQARQDPTWRGIADVARDIIVKHLSAESGLFRDCAAGTRRLFGSFATQVYCALSLYQYAESFDDGSAAARADRCVARLIELQGPYGEWPWFFDATTGRVLDFYEVYSVHQHGMGPAMLKHAIARGVPGAREALERGFRWILGHNELGVTMLRPELSLIARSQARLGVQGSRGFRLARAFLGRAIGLGGRVEGGGAITVTPEVRSYELGWTLWAFADDVDFPNLTEHAAFQPAAALTDRAIPAHTKIPAAV